MWNQEWAQWALLWAIVVLFQQPCGVLGELFHLVLSLCIPLFCENGRKQRSILPSTSCCLEVLQHAPCYSSSVSRQNFRNQAGPEHLTELWVSLVVVGELHQMAFKGPSQPQRVCDSMGEQFMCDLSNIRSSGTGILGNLVHIKTSSRLVPADSYTLSILWQGLQVQSKLSAL